MTMMSGSRGQFLRACSILAIGCSSVFAPNAARAACAPDPTQPSSTTTCSGGDTDGLTVTTNATTVSVETGATVSATSGPAVTVAINAPSNIASRTATILVAGAINGNSSAGIRLTEGTQPSGYYGISTNIDINVAEGGSVSGANAITLGPVASFTSYTRAALDNAGSLIGTSGLAVVASGTYVSFTNIVNRASGTIGGISGSVGTIDNAGLIDGGSGSAITGATPLNYASLTNSGQIVSNGAASTIYNLGSQVTNSGRITNSGSGATISASNASVLVVNQAGGEITSAQGSTLSGGYWLSLDNAGTVANLGTGAALNSAEISVTNNAGGVIRSSGTAISASNQLNLVNKGVITGTVLAGSNSSQSYSQSNVDSTGGTIEGDLVFGAGNDVLHAIYTEVGDLITGVTGSIDGGAGTDSVQIDFAGDRTLDKTIVLPTNFERTALVVGNAVTVTLADGFSVPGALAFDGSGTLRNETDLSANGTVISNASIGSGGKLVNAGIITSTGLSENYALDLDSLSSFTNSGTINSQGAGVDVYTYAFDNSGTISATGTAAEVRLSSAFSNTGTITSANGTGLVLWGSSYTADLSTNSGTISGGSVGVDLSAGLANTGTISSPATAVLLGSYGNLDNRAGGTISGGTAAIAVSGSSIFNAQVKNAGTINGDVSLAGRYSSSSDNNRYYALAGGVLNGNLTLGKGSYLITELENEGTGEFAGINGTVTASESYLRYEVRKDANATLASHAGFASVGYQLHDDAALTLDAEGVFTTPLTFSGEGSVDLMADIDARNQSAISSTGMLSGSGYSGAANALDITSRGTITATLDNAGTYIQAAVGLGSGNHFTNEGTIALSNTSGVTWSTPSAIWGGSVTNKGTITATGGNGLAYVSNLDNSGTISASAAAVYATDATSIVNSGTIASTGQAAIVSTSGYTLAVENSAGGTIYGGAGVAIQSNGGTLRNAGTIVGDVDLGWSSYGYSATRAYYYADGGSIEGDLRFGSGDDVLIEDGSGFGVSGTIDGGSGYNQIGHVRKTSGTVTLGAPLPTSFEGEFTGSLGSDTVVTIVSDAPLAETIVLAGNGQIVNRAATSAALINYGTFFYFPTDLDGPLASLSNEADVGGITVAANALSNRATVGSEGLMGPAVSQWGTGALSFENSGTITAADSVSALGITGYQLTGARITNSGTIRGGNATIDYAFAQDAISPALTFSNSGAIETGDGLTIAPSNFFEQLGSYSLALENSGTLSASASGASALNVRGDGSATITIANTGTIRSDGDGYEEMFYGWIPLPGYPYYDLIARPETFASTAVSVSGSAGPVSFVNAGTIEAKGAYAAAIRVTSALDLVNTGTIDGTSGYTVTADNLSAETYGTTRFAGAVQTFGRDDRIVNSGTIIGSIDLGGGNDYIENTGSIIGDVYLGDGDDLFVQRLSAVMTGTVDGGAGNDTLLADLSGGGALDSAFFQPFTGFENFGVTGSGSVTVNGVLPVQTLVVSEGATFELAAGSTLQTLGETVLTGTDGSEHVVNRGTIIGNVALGGGNDVFEAFAGSSVSGVVDGGTGTDRLALHFDQAATAPTAIDLNTYANFEELAMESGTGSLASDAGFDGIWVNGGRLIGLAGSTITARNGISVAQGATFGSAGTVNGNIRVEGTLSPGASPGTMTVNGNVTLASGSTTLFEMTPTVSDALIINGSLTIANGTTLNIVGERPLTPGVTYHLITTTDGITGSFSRIDKVQTVLGYIVQTSDTLDLLGTLQLHAGAGRNVTATNGYLNDLLIAGTASDGLLTAVQKLTQADGYVNEAAMSTLHPAAYAVAGQIGIDNGLAISSALRASQRIGEAGKSRFFMLGQGLGSWQNLRGNSAQGTSNVRQNSGGLLGGIGYQAGPVAVAAVVGRIYANQSLPALGARTKADGTFVGASVSFERGGLDLGGSVVWDGSSATTHRSLFDRTETTGHYDLHSLTFDAHGGYGFAIGKGGWRLGPELGVTHIRVKRGDAHETGNDVFALDVAGRKQDATFVSADLRLDMAAETRLRPWLTAGWRYRAAGDATLATAGLPDASSQFTVAGAERDRNYAQVGGGFDWAATPGITLFARGNTAFTRANGVTNVTGGIRLGF
jgi:hypothetical protein